MIPVVRTMLLPWLPRHLLGAATALAITLALGLLLPAERAFLGLGQDGQQYRVFPAEYCSAILAVVLCILNAPRMPHLERFGATAVRIVAVANVLLVTAIPTLTSLLISSANTTWKSTGAPNETVVIAAGHIVTTALVTSILIATLGPLLGPIISTFVVIVGLQLATGQTMGQLSPFPLTAGEPQPFILWTLLLGLGALVLAWIRRGVPLRKTLQLSEEP